MKNNAMIRTFPSIVALLIISLKCIEGSRIRAGESSTISLENMVVSNANVVGAMAAAAASSQSNETTKSILNDPFEQLHRFKEIREAELVKVKERARGRKLKARDVLKKMPQPKARDLEQVTGEQLERIKKQQQERGLNWFGDGGSSASGVSVSSQVLSDPSQYYDKWAQAYRMLGGFIDCDHDKSQNNNHHSGDQQESNSQNNGEGCSRWMIWASYVNPNYQGNEYDEYFGNSPTSVLDCHSPDTDWVLLGVYRQEFYQYVEQISKHLWAVDEYEYVVALAGLAYMTKYECFQVGNDKYGNAIKASVNPLAYGKWEIALYTDQYCLVPDDSLGMTYDDFGLGSDVNLGSKDKSDDYSNVYQWWSDAQEYTLTNMNDVYEEFKYCTSCVDYPTYQDGYFIGDYGTDDDDLINQCWKFYSHSSYPCEAECIAQAHAQGTILSVKYGDTVFGKTSQSFYETNALASTNKGIESPLSRLLASAFLTVAFILFIATFLAFAVARRSRYRESRSAKRQRLLDGGNADDVRSSARPRRSKSRARDGDGVYRGETSRSKSKDRRSGSSSRRSSSQRRRSRSKSYDAPKEGKLRRAASPRSDDY